MAFEIYNGIASDPNTIIDKLIEMWDFDSADQTSSNHSATWGGGMIYRDGYNICIGNSSSAYFQGNVGSSDTFKLIKTQNAILVAWYHSSAWITFAVGTITDINGNAGKGILGIISATLSAVFEGTLLSNVSSNYISTANGVQLVPHMAQNDYYTDGIYRVLAHCFANIQVISGKYQLGEDVYYISNGLAIKEE